MVKSSVIVIFILAVVISVMAADLPPHKTVVLQSKKNFCFFLPRKPGQDIGSSEDTAVAFCTEKTLAPKARQFPDGFIVSAHFKRGEDFVQVTGKMDGSKYKLSSSDGGGQYDTHAPEGAVCAGFKNFVNIVEPDEDIYCIRCCNDTDKCPTSRSTDGCRSVIGGPYN